MKLMAFALLFALSATAAEIEGGRYNAGHKAIELDLVYQGRCEQHGFTLKIEGCTESIPPHSCDAQLIENTYGDPCVGARFKRVHLNLHDMGLDIPRYEGAALTIYGDNDTSVTVTLP